MVDGASIAALIIDDLIHPDSRVNIGLLGGAAAHAAVGMRICGAKARILTRIGSNFPKEHLQFLCDPAKGWGIDGTHILTLDEPTPRAWQVCNHEGGREEIFRTPLQSFFPLSAKDCLQINECPPLCLHTMHPPESFPEWLATLQQTWGRPLVIWEPFPNTYAPSNEYHFMRALPLIDIFSPNLEEARQLAGQFQPKTLVKLFLEWGAPTVALRMGKDGCLLGRKEGREIWHIPAISQDAIDPTGAGNSFCGAFAIAYAELGDPRFAAQMGAVAASFTVEAVGLPHPIQVTKIERELRLKWIQHITERVA